MLSQGIKRAAGEIAGGRIDAHDVMVAYFQGRDRERRLGRVAAGGRKVDAAKIVKEAGKIEEVDRAGSGRRCRSATLWP